MKKNTYTKKIVLVAAFILSVCSGVFAQQFSEELRPFDFSDKYYYQNGVDADLIVNRRNAEDKHSVFDQINDERFRSVRIRSVFPAYDQNGGLRYWNLYGELYKEGFLPDGSGAEAQTRAEHFPIYLFPSTNVKGSFRQAHLIQMRDSYFEKNPLGLSVQVLVEFTDRINTPDGQKEMDILAARNGLSLDGTPIIRTAFEIEDLTRKDLVRQKIKGLDDAAEIPFAIAKVIENPQSGAIAGDAFMLNDLGLEAEKVFADNFACLQITGNWCGKE